MLYSSSRRGMVRKWWMLTPFSIRSLTKSTLSNTRASIMACSSEFTCPTQKHHHDNHPLPPASGSQICLDQSVTERMLVAAIQDDNITFSPVSYPVEQLQFPRVRLFRRFRFAFSSFSLLPPGFPFSPSC